jgi:hypothetical protein
MTEARIFGYGRAVFGRVAVTMWAHQDGQRFYVTLSPNAVAGLKTTTRPIMWAQAPKLRGARKWFREHADKHGLDFTFDR